MTEADRLFARIAIGKSFVTPAAVEEARSYLEQLMSTPGGSKLPLTLGTVLSKMGKLSVTQVAAVQKDMEASAFTCGACGKRWFRLDVGSEERRCENCRQVDNPLKDGGPPSAKGQDAAATALRPPITNLRSGAPASPGTTSAGTSMVGLARGGDLKKSRAQMFADQMGGAADASGGQAARADGSGGLPQRPPLDAPATTGALGANPGGGVGTRRFFDEQRPAPRKTSTGFKAPSGEVGEPGAPPTPQPQPQPDHPPQRRPAAPVPGVKGGGAPAAASPRAPAPAKAAPRPAPESDKTMNLSEEEILASVEKQNQAFRAAPTALSLQEGATVIRARPGEGEGDDDGARPRLVVEARETGHPPSAPDAPTKPVKAAPGPKGAAAAAPGVDTFVGRTIGGCRLEKFLGKGGMGSVYLAVQVDLDRPVAFKILSTQLTSDPKQVAQFFREAKALAKVEHPNIVPIYNAAKEEEVHFIVMKLVEGGSLEGIMRKDGPKFPIERAVRFFEQAAKGLLEAHSKGITHRDVKPENMLVAAGDHLMVTDFGLARVEGDTGLAFAEGRIVGTPYYMPPEQIDGRECDGRADIYALGATLYFMLTGHRPFTGDTPVEILLKHVNEALVPPRERSPGVPEGLSRIVEKMMAKDRDARYQSLREVLKDLDGWRKGEEVKVEAAQAKAGAPEDAKPFFADMTGSLAKGMPASAAEVVIERPRSFYYAVAGLGASTLVAIVLGLGPIRELMAAGADERDPREAEAARMLEQLAPTLDPSKASLEKVRAFVEEHQDTVAAGEAKTRAKELEAELQKRTDDLARKTMDEAQAVRRAGRFGKALEILHAFPKELVGTGSGLERAVEKEIAATVEELARTRRQGYVRAGAFTAGEGEWKRQVELPAFYVDLYEVSNREYAEYVAKGGPAPAAWHGKVPPAGTEDLPVTGVPARDAEAYARAHGKRLPTALEWERAARGVDGRRFPWGEEPDLSRANQRETGPGRLEPVSAREKGASPVGCLQMAGNAAEWVIAPPDLAGPAAVAAAGGQPVIWVKGGAYGNEISSCRAAYWLPAESRDQAHEAIGFRLVEDALE